MLFDYLRESKTPVVWTLHDCWGFTGHCSYFDRVDCMKWQTECSRCPLIGQYPKSLLDFSTRNFRLKKKRFVGLSAMTIVTPSQWLSRLVGQSFLSEYPKVVINNGVNLNLFRPVDNGSKDRNLILGVANVWSDRKGLRDFFRLREMLPPRFQITLVGVTKAQQRALPNGIDGVCRTESIAELVALYQGAVVLANPTYSDNFPTTNIEALACGTPVVTYDTGGSPEAIDESTGRVVPRGDITGMVQAISELAEEDQRAMKVRCRRRAKRLFNQSDRFSEYIDLFEAVHEQR
jgi:glycosyltransferase involved in cell wall biosynthesis